MSKDNQKYFKTLAKVCRKKKYVTALKSMSTTSKSMSQHTEYVKSSPIFLMPGGAALVPPQQRFVDGRFHGGAPALAVEAFDSPEVRLVLEGPPPVLAA